MTRERGDSLTGMSSSVAQYHWSTSEFVRAWQAGAFDHRVEMVEGEIWPVVIGEWHGEVVTEVIGRLRALPGRVTTATLPSASSLPDPDCWVRREGAQPIDRLGDRLAVWGADDVLLVVEVSDESLLVDLTTKARVYGCAGWPVYWVVTPEAIYEHTEPIPGGYRKRVEYRPGELIPLGYAGAELDVADLLVQR